MRFDPHIESVATLATLLALASLSACSTAREPPLPAAAPSVVQAPGRSSVKVLGSQSGVGVALGLAQEMVVDLPVNTTSGYEWTLVDLKPGVLSVLGSKFERAIRSANPEEAAGTVVWRFKPEAAGTVALRFELRRPHSLEPARQTVTYDVTVR